MSISPHPIALAANVLTTGPGTPKEKLVLGGKLIWAARTLPGDWTPALLEVVELPICHPTLGNSPPFDPIASAHHPS